MALSRIYWAVAHWRRGVLRRWHTADKSVWAAVLLLALVLAGFGFGLQVYFAQEDERRAAAREAERRFSGRRRAARCGRRASSPSSTPA